MRVHAREYAPDVYPPSDCRDPAAWIAGYTLLTVHYRSAVLGRCVTCNSPARPYCADSRRGYAMMRGSLADPGQMPEQPAP